MKYFNLDKIDTNSDEFQKWNKKAKQLEIELQKCSNSEERKEFFKKNPHWNEIKGLLKKHMVIYVGIQIVTYPDLLGM